VALTYFSGLNVDILPRQKLKCRLKSPDVSQLCF